MKNKPGTDDGVFIKTKHGYFRPLAPRTTDVNVRDIAFGLAGQFRYAGHSRLTVAQHSVVGSRYVESGVALAFLFHDAAEGLGLLDLSRPVKHHPALTTYCEAEERVLAAVWKHFDISPSWNHGLVKRVDDAMGDTERTYLWGEERVEGKLYLPLTEDEKRLWGPEEAETRFLLRYVELTGDKKVMPKVPERPVPPPTPAATASALSTVLSSTRIPRPPATFTQYEYARENNVTRITAMHHIRRLKDAGKVRSVKFSAPRSDGQWQVVSGWQLVDATSDVKNKIDAVAPGK